MRLERIIPLVNQEYLLERFPFKGGWTYVAIPEVMPNKDNPFGWVGIKGWIDQVEIQSKLMPMGKGSLFLPVKAQIRKTIGKQAGDWVKIVLYADKPSAEIEKALIESLQNEPLAYQKFLASSDVQQRKYVNWVSVATTQEEQVKRILQLIDQLTL